MTLLELIITCAILMVLATAAMPLARFTVKRQKEAELRRDLRDMRDAIDRYKDAADRNLIRVEAGTEGYPPDLQTLVSGVDVTTQPGAPGGAVVAGANGSVAGAIAGIVSGQSGSAAAPSSGFGTGSSAFGSFGSSSTNAGTAGQPLVHHVRFLRRIPVDPMTGHAEWGMRAVSDDPQSTSWGGKDVFDVFSLSTGTALDGTTKYSDW